MAGEEPQTLVVGEGDSARRIAYRLDQAAGDSQKTGLFWLSGFMSDMASTKATAISAWAQERGLAATRFDYSGHGLSEGPFTKGTIGRWLEEAAAAFTQLTHGPQIVIGSSMGGHIALLLLRHLMQTAPDQAARIKALLLIAPAWDMTEELMWKKFGDAARRDIIEKGAFIQPSNYASPYTITRDLIEDGRRHLFKGEPFDPQRAVVILQGAQDPDVPVDHVRRLAVMLGGRAKMIEIPDGEHRLSRPQDLALLFSELTALL